MRIWILILLIIGLQSCEWLSQNNNVKRNSNTATVKRTALHNNSAMHSDSVAHGGAVAQGDSDSTGGDIYTGATNPGELVKFAETQIGVPYVYASCDPKVGFDCSGFITYVFNHFKINVPRSSYGFTHMGKTVPFIDAKPGDIVLFTGTDSLAADVGHIGLVVSNINGHIQFIHSTSGKAMAVTISLLDDYYKSRFVRISRIFPQNE